MRALSPQFQFLLDQGQALKERVISGLDEGSKDALRFELKAWSNSVLFQTQDLRPFYGTEPLPSIFEYADFFVLGLRAGDAANQLRQAIEIIASIPPKGPSQPVEISVGMELQKLISLGRAAQRPSRKPWVQFVERLNEFGKTQALTFSKEESRDVSGLVGELLRNIEADTGNNKGQTQDFSDEYDQLKTTVNGKISSLAWLISRVTFLVPSLLIIIGAIVVLVGHPLHLGFLDVILGLSLIAFVVMELLGVLNHLDHFRTKLELSTRRRLRRYFGTEESSDEQVTVLGLGPGKGRDR